MSAFQKPLLCLPRRTERPMKETSIMLQIVWEQYGDQKSKNRNWTQEQGGSWDPRGKIIWSKFASSLIALRSTLLHQVDVDSRSSLGWPQ